MGASDFEGNDWNICESNHFSIPEGFPNRKIEIEVYYNHSQNSKNCETNQLVAHYILQLLLVRHLVFRVVDDFDYFISTLVYPPSLPL
jgi:hypothetical protein